MYASFYWRREERREQYKIVEFGGTRGREIGAVRKLVKESSFGSSDMSHGSSRMDVLVLK